MLWLFARLKINLKMKFKILLLFILSSCTGDYGSNLKRTSYESSGFAYVYKDLDKKNRIVSKKFNNQSLNISHSSLKIGTIVKIINPINNKSIMLKIIKKSKYPDFYSILITEAVAYKLELNEAAPFVQIYEIQKNKSFIADRAETYNEEKKVHSSAPVTHVKINDISKIEKAKITKKIKFSIRVAEFYSKESALSLRSKLNKELPEFDSKTLIIVKKSNNSYQLNTRAHKAINLLKNDYIVLKNYGFEELEIISHE